MGDRQWENNRERKSDPLVDGSRTMTAVTSWDVDVADGVQVTMEYAMNGVSFDAMLPISVFDESQVSIAGHCPRYCRVLPAAVSLSDGSVSFNLLSITSWRMHR